MGLISFWFLLIMLVCWAKTQNTERAMPTVLVTSWEGGLEVHAEETK
jgi:hypothetical protein